MRVIIKADLENLKDKYNELSKYNPGRVTGFNEALVTLGLKHYVHDFGEDGSEDIYLRYRGRDYASDVGHSDVEALLDTLYDYLRFHIEEIECRVNAKEKTFPQSERLIENLKNQMKRIEWLKENAAEAKE